MNILLRKQKLVSLNKPYQLLKQSTHCLNFQPQRHFCKMQKVETEVDEKALDRQINKQLLKFVGYYLFPFTHKDKELRGQLYQSYLMLTGQKIFFFASPLMLKYGINSFDKVGDPYKPIQYFVGFGLCQVMLHLTESQKNQLIQRISLKAWKQVSMESFEHLLKQDVQFLFTTSQRQRLFSLYRGHQAVEKNIRFLLQFLLPIFLDFTISTSYLFINFGPLFVLSFLGTFSAFTAFTLKTSTTRKPVIRKAKQLEKQVDAIISETMSNYYTVKYFNAEKRETEKYESHMDKYIIQQHAVNKGLWNLNSGQRIIFSSGISINLILSAIQVQQGLLTIGDIVLLQTLMMSLLAPLNMLGTLYREYTDSMFEIKEIFKLMNNKPKVTEKEGCLDFEYIAGHLEFRNINFSYESKQIIDNLNFEIEGGKFISLVGESGAGKTTLLTLLFRFYDPDSGDVLIDGQNLKDLSMDSFRQYVGVVSQNIYLFNESVYYNIIYGEGSQQDVVEFTDEQKEKVHELCKQLNLHDLIMSLPQQYESKLGEQGSKFSGGEKQRLSLSRCLMKKNMKILLLDEPTSAIDSQNEQAAIKLIRKEQEKGLTVVMTTHRLHLNQYVDEVVMIAKNEEQKTQIVRGQHYDLINQDNKYSQLWNSYVQEEKQE